MLVLSRHEQEWVDIRVSDRHVQVCVIEIEGNRVRLGFDAPIDVIIHRREVAEQIERDNAAAPEELQRGKRSAF